MNLKYSFLLSIAIHGLFFIPLLFTKHMHLPLNNGSAEGTTIRFSLSGAGDKTETGSDQGVDEIQKIKNKISYPAIALEQKLESDCEWEIVVAKDKHPKSIIELKKCKYSIFSDHFRNFIQGWEFNLSPGTVLKIPISFKIRENP